jgi:hypothetical protein
MKPLRSKLSVASPIEMSFRTMSRLRCIGHHRYVMEDGISGFNKLNMLIPGGWWDATIQDLALRPITHVL